MNHAGFLTRVGVLEARADRERTAALEGLSDAQLEALCADLDPVLVAYMETLPVPELQRLVRGDQAAMQRLACHTGQEIR